MSFSELQRERLYPWLWSIVSIGVLFAIHYSSVLTMPSGDAYKSALLTLGGIFAGFMATLNALLYAMRNVTVKRLQNSGYFKELLTYLNEAMWSSLLLCFLAWLAFWIPDSVWQFEAVLSGLVVFSMAALYRVARIAGSLLATRIDE